jgi:zinc transport system permease protein
MDDFVLRAAAAGLCVALAAAPLGCFVVWRRMAYFGAALSHAALLGVALGLLLEIDLQIGVMVSGTAIALLLGALQRRPELATDTLLGILAHGSLALGLVALSLMPQVRVDLLSYLFGDVLAVDGGQLLWIAAGSGVCLLALAAMWRPLLAMTVDEDLARVEGVRVERIRLAFLLLCALVVAVAMQIVGLLMTVSLLILPAAAARRMAATPEAMAMLAAVAGALAVLMGLLCSLAWDTPAGPSIVVAASGLFALSLLRGARPAR